MEFYTGFDVTFLFADHQSRRYLLTPTSTEGLVTTIDYDVALVSESRLARFGFAGNEASSVPMVIVDVLDEVLDEKKGGIPEEDMLRLQLGRAQDFLEDTFTDRPFQTPYTYRWKWDVAEFRRDTDR